MRRAIENALAFLLRDTTQDAKHFPFAVSLELVQAMKDLLLGFVANAAGVIKHQVGLVRFGDLLVAL